MTAEDIQTAAKAWAEEWRDKITIAVMAAAERGDKDSVHHEISSAVDTQGMVIDKLGLTGEQEAEFWFACDAEFDLADLDDQAEEVIMKLREGKTA